MSSSNLIEKLNLSYSNKESGLLFMNSSLTLAEISNKVGIPLNKLKNLYKDGLLMLQDIINAYNLCVEYEDSDFVDTTVEQEWDRRYAKKLAKFNFIGIDEFAVIYSKDKNLLNRLIMY